MYVIHNIQLRTDNSQLGLMLCCASYVFLGSLVLLLDHGKIYFLIPYTYAAKLAIIRLNMEFVQMQIVRVPTLT